MHFTKNIFLIIISAIAVAFFFTGCSTDSLSKKEIPITTSSDEALKLYNEGLILIDNIKFPQATAKFEAAIALDSNFVMAYLYQRNIGSNFTLYSKQLQSAFDRMTGKLSDGEIHMIRFNTAVNRETSQAELDTLLMLYPEDKRVHLLAGNFYFNSSKYPEAVEQHEKAIGIDSSFAPCYNQLGYINMAMENFPEAEKAFKKYIELIPGEANPYDSYAEFLQRQGRFDESTEQYKKAIQTDPEFITSLLGIGNNFIFKKDFTSARDYYQQYYDKAFTNNQKLAALWWKAISFIYEGNKNEALNTIDERSKLALANNTPFAVLSGYWLKQYIYFINDNFAEAEKYNHEAMEFLKTADLTEAQKKNQEISLLAESCHLMILKKDIKNAEKSLAALKQSSFKEQFPWSDQFLNLLNGMLEYKKGNNDAALEYFKKGDQESPYLWFCEAVVLEKSGKADEAKKMYMKIVNNKVNSAELALVMSHANSKL